MNKIKIEKKHGNIKLIATSRARNNLLLVSVNDSTIDSGGANAKGNDTNNDVIEYISEDTAEDTCRVQFFFRAAVNSYLCIIITHQPLARCSIHIYI